ncbi:putative mitochondrial protein AtMg00860 [Bidens hawaiensis]|uniref:putative mitochondrial protein AtMg00860 n=1 Tax=Bidens hawaiensis TaxID=980011 RepID=UPI00404A1D16
MKLNPAKCSFGMEKGKFLGVIVTAAGFKANPDKIQAVACMPSPSSLKEVQTLNGRLVAPNRFLANHAAKSYPFVSTLRNCLKKAQIKWTAEAEQAFLEVKNA